MKKKNLAFLFAAAVLGLAACGGTSDATETPEETGTQQTTGKTATKTSTRTRTSTSKTSTAPRPSASIGAVDVVAKEGKMYLKITGTVENIEAAEFKFALGLQEYGTGSAGSEAVLDPETGDVITPAVDPTPAVWLVGKEAPAADDYNLAPVIDGKNYTLEYNVSDIANLHAGIYSIYAGTKTGISYAALGSDLDLVSGAKDSKFRGYTRNDQNVGSSLALCIDELPPITLTEAKVVYEDGKLYAMIGGTTTKTLEELKAYESYLNFQNINGWGNTRVYKTVAEPQEGRYYYDYVIENEKAYIKADVSFFSDGGRYNTHLNITENTTANCKLETAIDETVAFAELGLSVNVFSDPTKGQADGEDYFWGNLGFIVAAID